MKKPIHLYIFVVLSGIASVWRVIGAFSSSPNTAQQLAQQQAVAGVATEAELLAIYEPLLAFQTGIVQKIFGIVLLLLVVGAAVFLLQKKNELASYVYMGYLFGTLLMATYTFIVTRGLFSQFANETMRSIMTGTVLGSYILSVVLFAIYFGLTVFFLLRKPKETPNLTPNATDI